MLRSKFLWAAGLALAMSVGATARAEVAYYGLTSLNVAGYPGLTGITARFQSTSLTRNMPRSRSTTCTTERTLT
jgi:hypothetical protein